MSYINVIIRDIPEMNNFAQYILSYIHVQGKPKKKYMSIFLIILSKHFLTTIGSPIFDNQDAKRFSDVK